MSTRTFDSDKFVVNRLVIAIDLIESLSCLLLAPSSASPSSISVSSGLYLGLLSFFVIL